MNKKFASRNWRPQAAVLKFIYQFIYQNTYLNTYLNVIIFNLSEIFNLDLN
jgi:hypothetical protein